jgi:hypothetical protein
MDESRTKRDREHIQHHIHTTTGREMGNKNGNFVEKYGHYMAHCLLNPGEQLWKMLKRSHLE